MAISKNHVALLGTKGGPAIRPGSTMPTSSLLCLEGHRIVVDCGLGVTRGLVDQGMHLQHLSLIFITHLHSDHYLELGPLIHTAWTAGLKTPVTVYGPAGLSDYWDAFLLSMKADIDLRIEDEGRRDLRQMVSVKVLEAGRIDTGKAIAVTAMRNDHPPLIDSFALSFKSKRHHVVFSGDTAHFPPLIEFARGADLLIHEAMLEEALVALVKRVGNSDDRLMKHLLRSHTIASDAAKIATAAGVKALALNHLIPSDDPDFMLEHWKQAVCPHWAGAFHLGSDGARIDLD
jgi:ribonuclease BN (tRNA processing enzyme)